MEDLKAQIEKLEQENKSLKAEIDMLKPAYCPKCGACGEEGCCSGSLCKANACLYGKDYELEYKKNKAEIIRLELQNAEYVQALNLIAAPARPDGTFNRCREACQKLAAEALKS